MGKVATAPLPDGRLQVWFVRQGGLTTTWKETSEPDAGFTRLQEFDWDAHDETPVNIAGGTLPDGRIQLWAVTSKGNLLTTWKESVSSDADWKGWSAVHPPSGIFGGAPKLVDLATGRLPDGRMQVFVMGEDERVWTFWRNGDGWSDWQLLFS